MPIQAFLPAVLCLCVTLALTAALIPLLERMRVLDTPNARSNHARITPRGGGIALLASALLFLALAGFPLRVSLVAFALAVMFFVDDLRGLPVLVRLSAQVAAVAVAIPTLPGRIFPDAVPLPAEWLFVGLAWIWFINLMNFMDGIDGISAIETLAITLGIVCVSRLAYPLALWSAILGAGALGFYAFNRSPARIFLGDAGSIPLGFLLGFLLLSLAARGQWAAALTLPAYYLGDATLTLARRALRGERVWQAHSEHAYQQAVRAGLTHAQVVWQITLFNALLVALAMLSTLSMMAAILTLAAAFASTALFLHRLAHVSPVR